MRVRVVTYNVRGFRAGVEAVAAATGALAPDVLLVQESGPRRAVARFAGDLGMRVAADPASPLRRRVKNAVLVRPPWRISAARLGRFPASARWFPRGALVAELEHPGGRLCAVSTHLGLDGVERGRHSKLLVRIAAERSGAPVVLGGDLNATPDRLAPARLAADLRDAWLEAGRGAGSTFPASAPGARIDYLFVSGDIEVTRVTVGGEGAADASDHLPVAAELEVRAVGSAQ